MPVGLHPLRAYIWGSGMEYIGSCLMCSEEKVRVMLLRSRPIAFRAGRRAIGEAVLRAWALSVNHTADISGREPDPKEDAAMPYHRSRYDVLPCVYVVHMRIRHIFI
jgi:hypothetical protein